LRRLPIIKDVLRVASNSTSGILFVAAIVLLCGWVFGQRQETEATQAAEQWSVETHDRTNFPLVGKHRTVTCRECHLDGVFEGTPTTCEACHWERRQDDRYALQLGIHCADCHEPFTWKHVTPNKWNHEMAAGYPLEGIHMTLDCIECHSAGSFRGASADCFGCHEKDYSESRNPDHKAAGFSTACQECHFSGSAWHSARFSHDFYPLSGQHAIAVCSDCHSSGQYAGLPADCVFCHQSDYDSAQDPNHRESGFPTDCEACHGTDASTWEGAVFTHAKFPLKGKHRIADCNDCHSSGQYEGLPSVCVFCHLEDYLTARDPDHKQMGFHTDCEVCHGTDAVTWEKANFFHSSFWALQGAHTDLDCSACHVNGLDLPRNCIGCHKADYNSARNPNHRNAGFPTDCEFCHYPSHLLWSQVKFNHSFLIESGKHSRWECTDCHTSANYRDFSCINCHNHNKTRMDKEHNEVPGYSYNSQSCYACHPQGRE
jgi:hypothetical protein